jgi:hypothetical protein
MPLIHIDGRSYTLPSEADQGQLAEDVAAAIDAKKTLKVQVTVGEAPVTLFVNTALVRVIALDWDGTGAGFFHG